MLSCWWLVVVMAILFESVGAGQARSALDVVHDPPPLDVHAGAAITPTLKLSAEARLDIVQLYAEHSKAEDTADVDAWLRTYSNEATLETSSGSVQGREQLAQFFTAVRSNKGAGRRHLSSGHIITLHSM
eukprot:TRINITY_DN7793_c0_g1_i1.p1 TRINITY_DN7793_c0_g1~~TRINITY_DN7793_c0_g1_i1.p1  ORF type:complete len:130 (+),score=37.81 TRINITY_DN7793_c0_g1_i1:161-550(+)